MLLHHLEQHKRGVQVVVVVFDRLGHGLAHGLETGEVNDPIDVVFGEDAFHKRLIAHVTVYGTSKLFQEQILRDVHVADSSWTIVLLRYFNPVGAHESGLLGEDPKGIPANLTPYVAKVAVGELKEVQVYGDDYDTPDGTGVRDYIHVVDLAKGHVAVIDHIDKEGVFVYNLGTGHGYSVLEVIKAYEKAAGHPIPYAIKPRRPGDIAACYADASKAEKELGWKAELTIDDMAASSLNWQTKNPNGFRDAE